MMRYYVGDNKWSVPLFPAGNRGCPRFVSRFSPPRFVRFVAGHFPPAAVVAQATASLRTFSCNTFASHPQYAGSGGDYSH